MLKIPLRASPKVAFMFTFHHTLLAFTKDKSLEVAPLTQPVIVAMEGYAMSHQNTTGNDTPYSFTRAREAALVRTTKKVSSRS
jgi:hypothetical protein